MQKTTASHSQHAQAIVRYLTKRGAWYMRIRAGWGMRKGLPDILCCYRGQMIAIEVKTGRGRLTPQQKRELDSLRAAGALVLVGDAPTVVRQLQAITQDPQPALWE